MLSLDALRRYVTAPAGPDTDALLAQLERAAVAVVSAHTGRYLGVPAQRVETLAGTGTTALWLQSPPAGDPPTVTSVEALPFEGAAPQVVGAGEYRLDGSRLVRTGGYPWYPSLLYRVTYEAGYEEDAAPDDVTLAVLQLVSAWWKRRGKEDVTSESIGIYSYSRASGDEGVRTILAALPRRVRV